MSVLSHVISRLREAEVLLDPYPHFCLDNIFPDDYYAARTPRLMTLTTAQLRAAFARHLNPASMKIVAVGELAQIEPQLVALKLGTIAHYGADGLPPK